MNTHPAILSDASANALRAGVMQARLPVLMIIESTEVFLLSLPQVPLVILARL